MLFLFFGFVPSLLRLSFKPHGCIANGRCRDFLFRFYFIFVFICNIVIEYLCCLLFRFAVIQIYCGCEMHHGFCVKHGGARGEFPCVSFVIAADSRVLGVFRDSAQVAAAGPPRVTSPRGPCQSCRRRAVRLPCALLVRAVREEKARVP